MVLTSRRMLWLPVFALAAWPTAQIHAEASEGGILSKLPFVGNREEEQGNAPIVEVEPATQPKKPKATAELEALPRWGAEDEQGEVLLGGDLWPTDARPDPGELERLLAQDNEPGPAAERGPQPDPDELALAERMARQALQISMERANLLSPLDLQNALSTAPESFLVDPQNLITEQKRHDLTQILHYMAGESAIPVWIVALGDKQILPRGFDPAALHERWFGPRGHQLLVIYQIGNPGASYLEWGEVTSVEVSYSRREALRRACLKEALVANEGVDQLERFAIELSVRIPQLSLSHDYGAGGIADLISDWSSTANAVEESGEASRQTTLLLIVAGSTAALALIVGLTIWWIREAREKRTVFLPDLETYTRLGGAHTGGGHPVLHYGPGMRQSGRAIR